MSAATLDELGLTPPAAVDEDLAGVLWPEAGLDTGGWPGTGPWSMIRRDVETGAGVPLLRVPHLERNAYHRLLCIAVSRGLINKNDMHLGKWVQEDDGPRPRIGPGGALAWHHRDMLDFAQHYADYTDADKPTKCCTTTFWNRLRKLRGIGLVFWVERAAGADRPARYEVCVRADSPLLRNLPEDLAAALHLGTLSRLLGEHELPEPEVASGAALSRIVEAYGGAQLEPEQAADAAVVSLVGKHEIAMLHAVSREQEETVARLALAAARGWADPDARPSGAVPPPAHRPFPAPRPELSAPGRLLPAGLKDNLARLVGIKRAVIRGVELASLGPLATGPKTELKTLPITEMGFSPYGLSSEVSRGVTTAQKDGRSRAKGKAAPTARIKNSGAAFGLAAWGRPVAQDAPVAAPQGRLRAKFTPAELEEAERVARQVWAIFRDRRPTQTLLGQWVTGPDGLSVWEAGDGWDGLIRLLARCLRRFAVSAVIEHAAASVSEGVRDPVAVLCNRLWRVSRRLDAYAHRPDRSKPAAYLLAEQDLDPREQGRRHQARVAGAAHDPDVVAAADSSSAEELREGQDRLRAQTGQWREQAEKPITVSGPHRAWVDDSNAPAVPRPSLEQVEADLAALIEQNEPELWPDVQGAAWDISPDAARQVARDAAEARTAAEPIPDASPRPSSEEAQAAALAKRQADRDAEAVRTPAQQAVRDALRQARGE